MKSVLLYLLIVVLMIQPLFIYSKSKTNDLHDRMENADTEEDDDDEDSDDDEEDEGCYFLSKLSETLFTILFNFDLGSMSAQPVRYNPFPYGDSYAAGHRNTENVRYHLANPEIAGGIGLSEKSDNIVSKFRYNFYGFSFNLKHKYISEEAAEDDIQYYSIMLERKSAALPRCDGGISAGWNDLSIGGNHYSGFSLGYNLEIYFYNPLSYRFQIDNMFYKKVNVTDISNEFRFHYKNYYLGAGHNYFDAAGVIFRSFMLNIGMMF